MSVLLVVEHDNLNLKAFTLNAISAASKIDTDIHVLVAGNGCESVSKEVGLIVTHFFLSLLLTVAKALPA